jgi:hypothetical protein
VCITEDEVPDLAVLDRRFRPLCALVSALLVDAGERDAFLLADADHAVDPVGVDVKRFLTEDVCAGSGGLDGDVGVGPAGSTDADGVDVGVFDHLGGVGVGRAVVLLGELVGSFGIEVGASDQLCVLDGLDGVGVGRADTGTAHDGVS